MTIGEPTLSFDFVSPAAVTPPPFGAHRTAKPPGRRRPGEAGTRRGGEAKDEETAAVTAASNGCSILYQLRNRHSADCVRADHCRSDQRVAPTGWMEMIEYSLSDVFLVDIGRID